MFYKTSNKNKTPTNRFKLLNDVNQMDFTQRIHMWTSWSRLCKIPATIRTLNWSIYVSHDIH